MHKSYYKLIRKRRKMGEEKGRGYNSESSSSSRIVCDNSPVTGRRREEGLGSGQYHSPSLEDESSLRRGSDENGGRDFFVWEARERVPSELPLPPSCMPRYEVMTVDDVASVKPAKIPTAAAVPSWKQEKISISVTHSIMTPLSLSYIYIYIYTLQERKKKAGGLTKV